MLEKFEKGQFARFKANPHYCKGSRRSTRSCCGSSTTRTRGRRPEDAASSTPPQDLPGRRLRRAREGPEHPDGRGLPGLHDRGGDQRRRRPEEAAPGAARPEVRQAIGHAIDKQTHREPRAGRPRQAGETLSVVAEPELDAGHPGRPGLRLRPRQGAQMLEDAGYKDTDGDGVREMPGGGQPLNFTLLRALGRRDRPADRRVRDRLAEGDRHRHHQEGRRRQPAHRRSSARATTTCSPGAGCRSWTPTRCSRTSPATRSSSDPEDPTNYYNDANYCDPEYDKLYQQQKVELDAAKRERDRPRDAHALPAVGHVYHVLYTEPETPGLRKGRFEGFVRQPAKIGPILYSNTSPTYAQLKPVERVGAAVTTTAAAAAAIIAIVVACGPRAGSAARLCMRRRRTADERE